MKKIIAISLTVLFAGVFFAVLPAKAYNTASTTASNIISPTAPTFTQPDRTITGNSNELSTIIPSGSTTRNGSGTTKKTLTSRTYTKTYTNDGKDDPSSPNYTGDVDGVRDNSDRSPDTATGPSIVPVIVAISALVGTFAFAGKSLNKKEEDR